MEFSESLINPPVRLDEQFSLKTERGPSEPDVFNSSVGQPLSACPTCFPIISTRRPSNYVNILDFAYYGGVSWPRFSGDAVPSRWFSDIRYTISTPLPHKYSSVTKDVLSSQRVRNAVHEVAIAEHTSFGRIQKRAVMYLNKMKAKISKTLCKAIAYLLFKVFRRIMTHLLVCPAQMEQVKKAQDTGVPLVFLPLHRSHLDYFLITWTVWHWGIQLPHIASGDNLNLSGFGWLLRAAGAYFIRRRIGDEPANGTDKLYRAVLNSYMTAVLQRGMPLEFFLEGTRSRFGKTLLPKSGLISCVVEAVQQGFISDVYLVPVSFTYERLAEEMFFDELMGKQKKRESVWGTVKGIWQSIGSGRCGAVRIHFGAPVLLSDHMRSLKIALDNCREQLLLQTKEPTYSYRELLPWQRGNPNSALIRSIALHVVYDAAFQASISVCSAVSALILCKYAHGGSLRLLANDLAWLCDTLVTKGFDVLGWVRGRTDGNQALQKALPPIETSIDIENDCFVVSLLPKEILRLSYYKNAILSALCVTSAVSLAVLSHRASESITDSSVIETAIIICDLLQFEIIFCKPCENLRTKIAKEVNDFSEEPLGLFRTRSMFENNRIEIINEEAESILQFYANIIKPFLLSLQLTTKFLLSLEESFKGRDIDFIRLILAQSNEAEEEVLALQALNSESLNNSLKLLREKNLLLEGPEIALNNIDNAHNFLSTLQHLLTSSK